LSRSSVVFALVVSIVTLYFFSPGFTRTATLSNLLRRPAPSASQVVAYNSTMSLHDLKFLTLPAGSKHTATVFIMHGLGDSGNGWMPVARMLAQEPSLKHIKWILPHAPRQPCTMNFGMVMPSWYDIYTLAEKEYENRKEDEEGLLKSRDSIRQLINKEIEAGIPSERIIVGGFSQGAVMSLMLGLTSEIKFAGMAILSGYIPLPKTIKQLAGPHANSLPVFWGHGSVDPLIPMTVARKSLAVLEQEFGLKQVTAPATGGVQFHLYEGMPHSADPEEIQHLGEWLEKIIPQ